MERLQKVLSHAGVASRRKSEELIAQGRVKVNGRLETELGIQVDPTQDRIEVNGKMIHTENLAYYIFYKPIDVITSVTDPQGRRVVMDFFSEIKERIYPVGRLDRNTSGLLVLTNDGQLAYQLMHPSFEIDKVYIVTVKGVPSQAKLDQLSKGIQLQDGFTAPAQVERLSQNTIKKESVLRLTIHEGRNRQVRRMCKAIHHPVKKLHREKYGFLTLQGLQEGEYRTLTKEEVQRLKKLVVT